MTTKHAEMIIEFWQDKNVLIGERLVGFVWNYYDKLDYLKNNFDTDFIEWFDKGVEKQNGHKAHRNWIEENNKKEMSENDINELIKNMREGK